jgi:hydroxypyruvate isomerase
MADKYRPISRRTAVAALTAAAGVAAAARVTARTSDAPAGSSGGRLKQSLCRWPYAHIPLPDLCRRVKPMGFAAIDLLFPDEWSVARDAGLTVSMGYASRRQRFIETGFNDPAHHALLLNELETALPLAARAQVPNVIAMFGNRVAGIDDEAAIANCASAGLAKIAPLADRAWRHDLRRAAQQQGEPPGLPGGSHRLWGRR